MKVRASAEQFLSSVYSWHRQSDCASIPHQSLENRVYAHELGKDSWRFKHLRAPFVLMSDSCVASSRPSMKGRSQSTSTSHESLRRVKGGWGSARER